LGSGTGGSSSSVSLGLSANIKSIGGRYKLDSNGNFGTPSSTGNSQVIYSKNPRKAANRLFNKLAIGAQVEKLKPRGNGQIAKFKDGSHVIFRPKSSHIPTNSPAVEIVLVHPSRPRQKIHFELTRLEAKESK
jgi:hypothetical protein